MKNVKYIQFITEHEYFYNLLSERNKKIISNLNEYKNLLCYFSSEDADGYVYIYIGIKNNKHYLYKCKYNLNNYNIIDNTYKNVLINFNSAKLITTTVLNKKYKCIANNIIEFHKLIKAWYN